MLKNRKNLIFSILLIGLLILSVQHGWCTEAPAVGTDIAMKTDSVGKVFGKFLTTMGGVILSILLIWGSALLYKNISQKNGLKKTPIETELNTPKTVDEAIAFFINKNRVR